MAAARKGLLQVGPDGGVAGLLSPHATNEENEALARLLIGAFPHAVLAPLPAPTVGEDIRFKGGFTICAERAANAAGVRRILEQFRERATDLNSVLLRAEKGELSAVYLLNGDFEPARPAGPLTVLRRASFVVAHDLFPSELALLGDVVFPGAAFAEKSGAFTNVAGYIQDFEAALAPPGEARPDVETLHELAGLLKAVPLLVN